MVTSSGNAYTGAGTLVTTAEYATGAGAIGAVAVEAPPPPPPQPDKASTMVVGNRNALRVVSCFMLIRVLEVIIIEVPLC